MQQVMRINEGLCLIIMYNTPDFLIISFYSFSKFIFNETHNLNHSLKCFNSNWISSFFNSLGGVEAAEQSGLGGKP